MSRQALHLGLMSGTSLDGVDGVVVDFEPIDGRPLAVLGHLHRPFDAALVDELLALNTSGADELHRAALAGNAVSRHYAGLVHDLLARCALAPTAIHSVGAHGQTVRHRPRAFDGTGYTWQLGNPALLAELTGIDVVADFRHRDIAAGGQGAPLVPAFHAHVFARPGRTSAVLNLGGIANLTVLAADGGVRGFDCGPANVLMDGWCRRHTGRPYDAGGAWAAQGRVHHRLLALAMAEPYFAAPPPKSTGRDLFDAAWLDKLLAPSGASGARPVDVQATLAEITALACASEIRRHAADAGALHVCGGGAYNAHLMGRLAALLPDVVVADTAALGLPPEQVEAVAFAWLARAFGRRRTGNLASVTGARGPRVLGALHPA